MLTIADGDDDSLGRGRLSCPICLGILRPWGYARSRLIRQRGGGIWVRPRRARCCSCGRTQVLLPCRLLERRRDAASDVGVILEAYARRTGYRRAARQLDIPVPTARNWVRGLRRRWSLISARFDRLAPPTADDPVRPDDPVPPDDPVRPDDPVTAVRAVHRAARRAGWSTPWEFASMATNGSLLVLANTS